MTLKVSAVIAIKITILVLWSFDCDLSALSSLMLVSNSFCSFCSFVSLKNCSFGFGNVTATLCCIVIDEHLDIHATITEMSHHIMWYEKTGSTVPKHIPLPGHQCITPLSQYCQKWAKSVNSIDFQNHGGSAFVYQQSHFVHYSTCPQAWWPLSMWLLVIWHVASICMWQLLKLERFILVFYLLTC